MENYKSWIAAWINEKYPNSDPAYNNYLEKNFSIRFRDELRNCESLLNFFKDSEFVCDGMNNAVTYLNSKAIQLCTAYRNDLLYSLDTVNEYLYFSPMRKFQYWFGFRDSGVDHAAFINCKLSAQDCYGGIQENYKEIFVLEVDKDKDFMNLYKVF